MQHCIADRYVSRGDHARWLVRVQTLIKEKVGDETVQPSVLPTWLGAAPKEEDPTPYHNPYLVVVKGWRKHTSPPTGPVPTK